MEARELKVAIYVPDLRGGGAERAALLLCQHWPEPDRVVLIVDALVGSLADSAPPGTVSLGTGRGPLDRVRRVFRLTRALRAVDVAIAFLSTNTATAAAHLAGRPVIATQQNPFNDRRKNRWSAVRRAISLTMIRTADALCAVAPGLASEARALGYRGPVETVGNPVSPDLLSTGALHEVRGAEPGVVCVARLAPQKRIDVLLDAVHRIHPRPSVKIFGAGPLEDALVEHAGRLGLNTVTFCGFTDAQDLIYRQGSVLALTSDYEGFGNVIVEALAFGLTVVSTDAPFGPSWLLDGGRIGYLAPVGDAKAVAEMLSAALVSAPSIQDLAARRSRAAEFSAPIIAARYRALAQDLRASSEKGSAALKSGPSYKSLVRSITASLTRFPVSRAVLTPALKKQFVPATIWQRFPCPQEVQVRPPGCQSFRWRCGEYSAAGRELHWRGLSGNESVSVVTFATLATGGTVFDVGANTGLYSLTACAAGALTLVAVEPVPSSAAALRLNLRRNDFLGSPAQVVEAALGRRSERRQFHVPYGPTPASASLNTNGFRNLVGEVTIVAVKTLDELAEEFGRPDLIKVDVEGFELDVLAGATETLRHRPNLILEANHDGPIAGLNTFAAEHGYVIVKLGPRPMIVNEIVPDVDDSHRNYAMLNRLGLSRLGLQ